MVICERCADGHIDFEASAFSVEEEFGSSKRIVFVELQETKIVTAFVFVVQVVNDKVKI